MKSFSISELGHLSGIQPHTIRIWEHRYRLLQPARTACNLRTYGVNELDRLLTIALLNRHGHRISQLSRLNEAELEARTTGLGGEDAWAAQMECRLIMATYRLDTESLKSILDACFKRWPAVKVLREVLVPFLDKMSLLREGKGRIEEHLLVTAIRERLHWCLEELPVPIPHQGRIILFLSRQRPLDLLLLYLCYELKGRGWKVTYLGVDISPANLTQIMEVQQPDYLLTYYSRKPPLSLADLSLRMEGCGAQLLLVNEQPPSQPLPHNVRHASLADVRELRPVALLQP